MSLVTTAIMPSSYAMNQRHPQDSTAFFHPSAANPLMAHPARSKPRGPPLHQTTWPLMTNTSSLQMPPPSSLPYNPALTMQNCRTATEIIPRLYISDLAFAENATSLSSHRITHVLSTLPGTIFCPPPNVLPLQPLRMQIRVEDLPFAELAAHLPKTTAWIRDALASSSETRVLVHCVEGISRSVSVVAAYLMAQYGWSPTEAVAYIKNKRRIADPNFGFVQQLHEYARDSLGRTHPLPSLPTFNPSFSTPS